MMTRITAATCKYTEAPYLVTRVDGADSVGVEHVWFRLPFLEGQDFGVLRV